MLWMERAVMVLMRSPYTVRLMHAFQTPDELVLVMPCYSGGDVHNHLQNGSMAESDILVWAAELLEGIAHIHSYHFVFRDIKPLNLLIDSEGHLAITDFGLCRLLEEKNGFSIVGRGGTRGYRSPEAAAGYAYDFSCDFFSFGVTLYEMATGRRKVQSLHSGVQQSSNDLKANGRLSHEFKDLVRRLTMTNPVDRLGCELSTKRMVERCRRLGLSEQDFNGNPAHYRVADSIDDDVLYPNEQENRTAYSSERNGKQFNFAAEPGSSSSQGEFAGTNRGSVSRNHNGETDEFGRPMSSSSAYNANGARLNKQPPSTPSNARAMGNFDGSRASGSFPAYGNNGARPTADKVADGWQYRSLEEIDSDNNFHWNAVRSHPWFRSINWEALPRRALKSPFVPQFNEKDFYAKSFEASAAPNLTDDTRGLPALIDRQQDLFVDFEFNIDVTDPINLNEPPPFTVDELTAQFIPSAHNTGATGSSSSAPRDRSISISQSAPSVNCNTYPTSRYDGVVVTGNPNGGSAAVPSRPSISTPKQTYRPSPSSVCVPHLDDDANDGISNINSPSTRKTMRANNPTGSVGSMPNPNLMAGKMQG